MKLLEQILGELGADLTSSLVLVPGKCCYIKSVKTVCDLTPALITVAAAKFKVTLEGENMEVGEYFQGDLLVNGNVRGVKID